MKEKKIRKRIRRAQEGRMVCNVFFSYDNFYRNLIPLKSGEQLLLFAVEDDFVLDGYTVRQVGDISKVKIKNDFCDEILKKEGLTQALEVPDTCLTDWENVFQSLKLKNRNIIIEKENGEKDYEFLIGRIERVNKKSADFLGFDANGVWAHESVKVAYDEITSVTFSSRYVEFFSKYIKGPSE